MLKGLVHQETNEMLKIYSKVEFGLVINIVNQVIQENVILSDWGNSSFVSCQKDEGDSLDRNDYRDIKLLD